MDISNNCINPPVGSPYFYTESTGSSAAQEAAFSLTTLFLSSMAYTRDLIASDATSLNPHIKDGSIVVLAVGTLAIGSCLSVVEGVARLALAVPASIGFLDSLYRGKIDNTWGDLPIMIGITALHSLGNVATSMYLPYEMLTKRENLDILDAERDSNLVNIF